MSSRFIILLTALLLTLSHFSTPCKAFPDEEGEEIERNKGKERALEDGRVDSNMNHFLSRIRNSLPLLYFPSFSLLQRFFIFGTEGSFPLGGVMSMPLMGASARGSSSSSVSQGSSFFTFSQTGVHPLTLEYQGSLIAEEIFDKRHPSNRNLLLIKAFFFSTGAPQPSHILASLLAPENFPGFKDFSYATNVDSVEGSAEHLRQRANDEEVPIQPWARGVSGQGCLKVLEGVQESPNGNQEFTLERRDFLSLPIKAYNVGALDLSHSGLERLPNLFSNLQNLKILLLGNNRLGKAPDSLEVLSGLTALERLDLSNNQLSEVPYSLRGLQNLRNVRLSGNRLETVPPSWKEWRRLQTLNLSDNQLTLPSFEGLANVLGLLWPRLEILALSGNPLHGVPSFLLRLYSLRELYLSNVFLDEVPRFLASLTFLRLLDFSNNILTSSSFGPLEDILGLLWPRLRTLIFSGNPLYEVPSSLSRIPSVQKLYLSQCFLKELPKFFNFFTSLRELDVSYNNLNELPLSILRLLPLTLLETSGNQLTISEKIQLYLDEIRRRRESRREGS